MLLYIIMVQKKKCINNFMGDIMKDTFKNAGETLLWIALIGFGITSVLVFIFTIFIL